VAYPVPTGMPQEFDQARVEPSLRSVAGQYLAIHGAVRTIERRLERTVADVERELGASSQLPEVRAAIPAVQATIGPALDDPATHRNALLEALNRLQTAWEKDIMAALKNEEDEIKKGAEEDIRRQLYRSAAARKPKAVRRRKFADGSEAVELPTPPSTPERIDLPVIPPVTPGAILGLSGPAALSPYVTLLIRSIRELGLAKGVQTAIVGLLFVAWAFGSLGADWDGTYRGLFTVFLAAFAIDVVADSLLENVKAA
jgi:hypothetical protein